MRAVAVDDKGTLTLNWMWLPTFVGMNRELQRAIGKHLEELAKERGYCADNHHDMDDLHEAVVEFIVTKVPEPLGLREYLNALRYVEDSPDERAYKGQAQPTYR